jgi:hypothetical protein
LFRLITLKEKNDKKRSAVADVTPGGGAEAVRWRRAMQHAKKWSHKQKKAQATMPVFTSSCMKGK